MKNLIHRETLMNVPIKSNGATTERTENFVCSIFYDKQKATVECWSTTRKDTLKCDVEGPNLKNLLTMLILSKQVPHLRIDEEKNKPRKLSLSFVGGKKSAGSIMIKTKRQIDQSPLKNINEGPLKTINEEDEHIKPKTSARSPAQKSVSSSNSGMSVPKDEEKSKLEFVVKSALASAHKNYKQIEIYK